MFIPRFLLTLIVETTLGGPFDCSEQLQFPFPPADSARLIIQSVEEFQSVVNETSQLIKLPISLTGSIQSVRRLRIDLLTTDVMNNTLIAEHLLEYIDGAETVIDNLHEFNLQIIYTLNDIMLEMYQIRDDMRSFADDFYPTGWDLWLRSLVMSRERVWIASTAKSTVNSFESIGKTIDQLIERIETLRSNLRDMSASLQSASVSGEMQSKLWHKKFAAQLRQLSLRESLFHSLNLHQPDALQRLQADKRPLDVLARYSENLLRVLDSAREHLSHVKQQMGRFGNAIARQIPRGWTMVNRSVLDDTVAAIEAAYACLKSISRTRRDEDARYREEMQQRLKEGMRRLNEETWRTKQRKRGSRGSGWA